MSRRLSFYREGGQRLLKMEDVTMIQLGIVRLSKKEIEGKNGIQSVLESEQGILAFSGA
jgi:hypothetical protein